MSINKVMISGNLTRDPELRALPSGNQVLTFGVAVNDRRRNQQTNEWEDYPNFIDCTMFGRRAESLSRFLTKGTKVAIEGKLRYSSWESNGQRRSKLDVIVDELEFMSSRSNNQGGQYQSQGYAQESQGYVASAPTQQAPTATPAQQAPVQQTPVAASPQQTPPSRDVYDEDIPF